MSKMKPPIFRAFEATLANGHADLDCVLVWLALQNMMKTHETRQVRGKAWLDLPMFDLQREVPFPEDRMMEALAKLHCRGLIRFVLTPTEGGEHHASCCFTPKGIRMSCPARWPDSETNQQATEG